MKQTSNIIVPRPADFNAWPKSSGRAVAVDWDGTCKDTMVPKWTRGFNLAITRIWPTLQPHQPAVDKACYDINMLEDTAGVARFVALKLIMQRLALQKIPVPDLAALFRAIDHVEETGDKHSTDTYKRLQPAFGYDDSAIRWSDQSDNLIEAAVVDAKVFDNCQRVLQRFQDQLDFIVVSASKTQSVLADLRQHHMEHLFKALCAQDFLPKKGTLAGLKNRYSRLMFIGDTRQDIQASEQAGVPFFLIRVGVEAKSWLEAESILTQFAQDA